MGAKEMTLLKVVLDTNVFVSAVLFGGKAGSVFSLCQNGFIKPCISREVLDEYITVLSYKRFNLTECEIKYLIEQELIPYAEPYNVTKTQNVIKADNDDNKFISLAVESESNYIISGDKHLLDLKVYENIQIIKISDFLNLDNINCRAPF